MKMIECDMCRATFPSLSSDAEAAARFEAKHHVDHASVETVPVCRPCAEKINAWWVEVGRHDPRYALGGSLH